MVRLPAGRRSYGRPLFVTEGLVERKKLKTEKRFKNMKNFLLLLVTAMMFGALANAAIVPCSTLFGPGGPYDVNGAQFHGAGNGCSISGVTFSNFTWENEAGGAPGPVFLVNVSQTDSVINLQFNPTCW